MTTKKADVVSVTDLDPEILVGIKADLANALDLTGKKFGVSITLGRGSYDDKNATLKMEVAVIDTDGEVLTREAEAFKKDARWFGLAASDLGRSFTDRGKQHKITGLRVRARRRPIATQCEGTAFAWPAEDVARLLKKITPTPRQHRTRGEV